MAAVAALAGCAGMPEWVAPGTPRAEIEARLGRPTGVYQLADGMRLQYSRQPAGQQVYNLDLDTQGRLRQAEQVLEPGPLARIGTDRWSRDDVRRFLGEPARVERVARFDGEVWTYRYLDITLPRQVHVHIDASGVVRRVLHTDEPQAVERPDWTP